MNRLSLRCLPPTFVTRRDPGVQNADRPQSLAPRGPSRAVMTQLSLSIHSFKILPYSPEILHLKTSADGSSNTNLPKRPRKNSSPPSFFSGTSLLSVSASIPISLGAAPWTLSTVQIPGVPFFRPCPSRHFPPRRNANKLPPSASYSTISTRKQTTTRASQLNTRPKASRRSARAGIYTPRREKCAHELQQRPHGCALQKSV